MLESIYRSLLDQALREDGLPWDWTTLGTLTDPSKKVRAKIIAKGYGVWAADALVAALPQSAIQVRSSVRNGQEFKKGQTLMEWIGAASSVLAYERPFLNLAAYACGIATRTAGLVKLVKRACPKDTPRVAATRKTLPGLRDVALSALQAGGGVAHRVNLAGGVLIKENHIAAAGGIARAIEGARKVAPHGLRVEIEVRNPNELLQALRAKADVIMLDNFTAPEVVQALELIHSQPSEIPRPIIEASGGLHEGNIAEYAIPGVDILSIGSLTHSVQATDLSLLVDPIQLKSQKAGKRRK